LVLREPGGRREIDQRATGLTLLFIAYADWLGRSAPLDKLRFVLGARRLPGDSDETA
jgi:hypothetical protein